MQASTTFVESRTATVERLSGLLNAEVLVHDVEENTYRRGQVVEASMNFITIQTSRGTRHQYPVFMVAQGYYEFFKPLELQATTCYH